MRILRLLKKLVYALAIYLLMLDIISQTWKALEFIFYSKTFPNTIDTIIGLVLAFILMLLFTDKIYRCKDKELGFGLSLIGVLVYFTSLAINSDAFYIAIDILIINILIIQKPEEGFYIFFKEKR